MNHQHIIDKLKRGFAGRQHTTEPESEGSGTPRREAPDSEQPETTRRDKKNKNMEPKTDEYEVSEQELAQENTDANASDEAGTEDAGREIAALQKDLAEAQDKYLRLAAEFDNYRKRTLREKMDLTQTAGESLLKALLPVVDDYERGIEAASKTEDMDAVRTGMDLIYSKLKDFLGSCGVKTIKALHEPFDADWHDAVTNIPAPSDDLKGKVVDVIQKGYTLNDKIIRYPKVVVGE